MNDQTKNRRVRIGVGVLAAILVLGVIVIIVIASSGDGAPGVPAGRWEKISESINAEGEVVAGRSGSSGMWESMTIYDDGKLTTDDSCRGVAESLSDGQLRLSFDCALGSVICDGKLLTNVSIKKTYGDYDGGNKQVVRSQAAEALQLTCPDDDVYVFVRPDDVPPTAAPTVPRP